ncbi:MAG: F0F1 ATP synthase subunit A [Isosphaeraceae bacterium]|nr:F0F1 ATP synthase subunit A [Isosphaeraceae bacterium]
MAAGHSHSPLSHAMDHPTLEIPFLGEIELGMIDLGFVRFQLTRFMVMELVAAAIILLLLIPYARHTAKNFVTRGKKNNLLEALVLFIRDTIARPSIGDHDGDFFVPYLGTVFLFILVNNLLGLIPGGASATGNINVTIVLAVSTLVAVMFAGMRTSGVLGFWVALVPSLDVPVWLKPVLWPLMFVIELLGLVIKHFVLAVRLFANMLAGHVVLGVILGFILVAEGSLKYLIAPASVMGTVCLSFLELLVAFLQAYIFTLLSALFIGASAHPH